MLPNLPGHGGKLALRQGPLGAEQGAAHRGPPVDRLPGHALDVTVNKAFYAVMDAKGVVACKRPSLERTLSSVATEINQFTYVHVYVVCT
jgi:hypothetical protein